MLRLGWTSCTLEHGAPEPALWLAAGELELLARLHAPKRREDWLLGRWTAKLAVSAWLGRDSSPEALAAIEILPAEDRAPEAYSQGRRLPVVVSLSHSQGRGMSTIVDPGNAVGCDLERVESRSPAFVSDYFTEHEQAWLRARPELRHDLFANLIWSAKESALKLLRTGLSVDTRCVEVEPRLDGDGPWRCLRVRSQGVEETLFGWWQQDRGFVMTVLASPAPDLPQRLPQALSVQDRSRRMRTDLPLLL